jgi:hypothetical protein
MNPQGRFQSVTQLPKPVNNQALIGFSAHTTIQSTPALFYPTCTTQENGPPSLPCNPLGCQLLPGSCASGQKYPCWDSKDLLLWEKRNICKCISNMHALIHGWNTPTLIITSKKTWLLSTIFFSFPGEDKK